MIQKKTQVATKTDTAILTHAKLDLLYATLYFFVAFWTGVIQKISVCHIL